MIIRAIEFHNILRFFQGFFLTTIFALANLPPQIREIVATLSGFSQPHRKPRSQPGFNETT